MIRESCGVHGHEATEGRRAHPSWVEHGRPLHADLMHGDAYPRWLLAVGRAAWLLTLHLAVNSVRPVIALLA